MAQDKALWQGGQQRPANTYLKIASTELRDVVMTLNDLVHRTYMCHFTQGRIKVMPIARTVLARL